MPFTVGPGIFYVRFRPRFPTPLQRNAMKIQFLGATQTVTGSRYLLTHGKTKVLIDCGLFQGFKHLRLKNWDNFPVPIEEIDAILLTHAHLDHSGYIPLLAKNGFNRPIYASPATIDLCKILLPDSGYLQEEEARFANKRGYSKHAPALPLYTVDDAKDSLSLFKAVPWREPQSVSKGGHGKIEFEFHPAGHMLGAASILVRADGHTIAFSGDLGRDSDPMIRNPDFHTGADTVVLESTYGNRRHPKVDPEAELKDVVLRTHKRNGIVLIPSFAVGRAQLILYFLSKLKEKGLIPNIPVYLNSPMAAQANGAFATHRDELKLSSQELANIWKDVKIIGSPEESKALNEKSEPAIIIAASGMASGGRVLHHLKNVAPNPKNTILFVGYQAGGTRGDLIVRGAKETKIHGQHWPIEAEVVNMESLSAHADADEVIAWVNGFQRKPKRIFVTHGEPEAADVLRQRMTEELGVSAIAPEFLQEFELR